MARNEDKTGNDKGKVKVRLIEFELDGSNQTLRESIKDIVGAIGRTQFVRVGTTATPALPAASGTNGGGQPNGGDVLEVDETEDMGVADEGDDSPSPKRTRSAPRTPELLDLDLKSGDMPLKSYLDRLAPDSEIDKYVAIAYWLKTYRQVAEVTADHIHTGYRHMGWQTPADAGSPLRSMKHRTYQYVKAGSKSGAFVLSHVGDNRALTLQSKAGMSA